MRLCVMGTDDDDASTTGSDYSGESIRAECRRWLQQRRVTVQRHRCQRLSQPSPLIT